MKAIVIGIVMAAGVLVTGCASNTPTSKPGPAVFARADASTSTPTVASMRATAAMFRLPVGTQRMQMPLDCEAASLTIALASVGVHTTQQYVQSHFPTDTRAPVLGVNRLPARWGDPYQDFVGHVMGSEPGSNPRWMSYAGWGAYAPVVARAAEALGVPIAAQLTGWNPQALYAAVEAGHPALVWSTVNYSSQTARTWTAWDGQVVPWTQAGHVVVLMGVNRTAGALEFSDPLIGGYNGTTMAQFARTFTIYGSMAIVIDRIAHAAAGPQPTPMLHVVAHPIPPPAVTPVPWIPFHHVEGGTTSSGPAITAGDTATSLGHLTDIPVVAAVVPSPVLSLTMGSAVTVAITTMAVAVFLRRRRRPCAG